MMTSTECLAQAAVMDGHANEGLASARATFLRLAKGWRRVAHMAAYQDEWGIHNEWTSCLGAISRIEVPG